MNAGDAVGPFVLERSLGRGGMGEVWAARHARTGLAVAIKLLHEAAASTRARLAFEEEIRIVAALRHPAIVGLVDQGTGADGAPWLALELADGGSLHTRCGSLSLDAIRAVVRRVADALGHVHARGVLHRDLKPANILVTAATDARLDALVQLADFGIATLAATPGAAVAGTLAYMPPEQLAGRWRDLGPWTDVFALGRTVLHLAAGQPDPNADLPEGLAAWIATATAPLPTDRFPSAAAAARALEAWTAAETLGHEPLAAASGRASPTMAPLSTFADAGAPHDPGGDHLLAAGLPTAERPRPPAPTRLPEASLAPDLAEPQVRTASDVGLGAWGVRAPPFVGREPLKVACAELLAQVAGEGSGRAVLLEGARGVGKSRLAQWVADEAHARLGSEVLVGRCAEGASGLRTAFETWAACAGLDHAAIAARLRHGVRHAEVAGDAARLADWLAPTEGRAGVSAVERDALVARVIARIAAARGCPVVLVLDDADEEDLASAARIAAAAPVLAVATREDPGSLAVPAAVRRREVLPLDPEASALLARRILPLDPDVAAHVAHAAAGVPRALLRVMGRLVDAGVLAEGAHGLVAPVTWLDDPGAHQAWRAALSVDPLTSLAGLAARFACRSDRAIVSLRVLVALGPQVDAEDRQAVLEALAIEDDPEVLHRLTALGLARSLRAGLVLLEAAPSPWTLDRPEDAPLHRACAAVFGRSPDPHLRGRAGRHLLAAGDLGAACERLDEAIGVLHESGLVDTAAALLPALEAAAADDLRGRFRLAAHRASILRARMRLEPSVRAAEEMVQLAQGLGPDQRANASIALALCLSAAGRPAEAATALETAVSDETTAWRPRALRTRALVRAALGDSEGALADAAEAVRAPATDADRPWTELVYADRLLHLGRYDEAREAASRARAGFEATGAIGGASHAVNLLALVASHAGDAEGAFLLLAESMALRQQAGEGPAPYHRLNRIGFALRAGRHAEARRALLEAAPDLEHHPRWQRTFAELALWCAAADGDRAEVRGRLDACRRLGFDGDPSPVASLLAARGDPETAAEVRALSTR